MEVKFDQRQLRRDLDKSIKQLRKIDKEFDPKSMNRTYLKAAKVAKGIIVEEAPVLKPNNNRSSLLTHTRYVGGKKVATYFKGNLKRSFVQKRSKIFKIGYWIGPKYDKKKGSGHKVYKGGIVDGFYITFIEKGPFKRPFLRRAWAKALPVAGNMILTAVNKKYERLKSSFR